MIIVKLSERHPWDISPADAREIQESLRDRVILHDQLGRVDQVAGVDVGFEDQGNTVRAAVAILGFPELELQQQAIARLPTCFPYVPGLLSFRELPGVLAALENLDQLPDLILCDGQGYAHPRRFGIACHLGVLTDLPTIGVGKSRLIGHYTEPGPDKGDWSPLMDQGEQIGAVLRTRKGVKPLFISAGHRVSLSSAIEWVLACTRHYKLPETTRWAHRLASG